MKRFLGIATILFTAGASSADTFGDQQTFTDSLDSFTIIDTSEFIGATTFDVNPLVVEADFFGPDALIRQDDLILNGSGFHGVVTPHVGINFLEPINAVGITSNPVDGGNIQLYSGPNATGTLINTIGFGGSEQFSFTGVTEDTLVGSAVFTCEFNQDLRCGLRDPVFGLVDHSIDSDADGIEDSSDNCLAVPNADQTDTDSDGYGNRCDADFNNDCSINFLDFTALAQQFLSASPLHDLTGDGIVNFLDVATFSGVFLLSPGPSGLTDLCD